jgi:hypothetical protein
VWGGTWHRIRHCTSIVSYYLAPWKKMFPIYIPMDSDLFRLVVTAIGGQHGSAADLATRYGLRLNTTPFSISLRKMQK